MSTKGKNSEVFSYLQKSKVIFVLEVVLFLITAWSNYFWAHFTKMRRLAGHFQ